MKTSICCICLLCTALQVSAAELEVTESTTPASQLTPQITPATSSARSSNWTRAGAACLGGAALGFILPGLGNIVGCVAGGLSAWWLNSGES